MIESHFLKEESSLIFWAKKLICIGEKFVPKQRVDDQKSINKSGSSRNILSRRAQMSTEICIVYKNEKSSAAIDHSGIESANEIHVRHRRYYY